MGQWEILTSMKSAIMTPLLNMAGVTLLLCCFAIAQQRAYPAAPSLTSIIQAMENSQSEVGEPDVITASGSF